jgi:hypothetical protein
MTKAQTNRRRRPKPGDIASLRRVLWSAIRDVEALIHDPDPDVTIDQRLRAVHALAAISGQYLKATEAAELVERIEALETAVGQQGGAHR